MWGAAATLLLPIVLAIVLGLGGLLGGLGDAAGSRACLRIGLVVGVMWLAAIVATAAGSAIAHLEPPRRRCDRPRRGRRRRQRWPAADGRVGIAVEPSGDRPA
jgi:hypothetical protein